MGPGVNRERVLLREWSSVPVKGRRAERGLGRVGFDALGRDTAANSIITARKCKLCKAGTVGS